MHSKHAGWISSLGGLALLLAGCSNSGGSGGGSFYVQTCSLGCTNGLGGTQVTCGVVNTFENQDIALLFSTTVDLGSVNKQSFQVFDVTTGAVPAGSFLVDSVNPRRLIFRPKLTFDAFGKPVFGFKKDTSYQIKLNGTTQKDPAPFVLSQGGSQNSSRVLCTITTDQGIIDPVPGKPLVELFVERIDPVTLLSSTVPLPASPPFPDNVSSSSKITFQFDELMNVGTIVNPSTGQAPFITVEFDADGLLSTTNDRSKINGSFAYSVNQSKLTTTAVYTPLNGYPSAGSNPAQPRLVVIKVPVSVADIAGTGLGNPGEVAFSPQFLPFDPLTIAEDFSSAANLDSDHSGANWNTAAAPPQVQPGVGGGSGRLGDLKVAAGQVRTLRTSPTAATATAKLTKVPINNDKAVINGVTFLFKATAGAGATNIQIRSGNIPWCTSTMVDVLQTYAANNPGSPVDQATYTQVSHDTMRVEHKTPGPAGNAFTLVLAPAGAGAPPGIVSSGTLLGGADAEVFSGPGLITNFDFTANPGVSPPDELVATGVFEFGAVEIAPGATLRFLGDNPPRILVRGNFDLQDTGLVDLAGEDRLAHRSDTPYGQTGGLGGPGGGAGGRGADRSSSPIPFQTLGGVTVGTSSLEGSAGEGVGGTPHDPLLPNGEGEAGIHWPPVFPTDVAVYNDLALDATTCLSTQTAGTGSGAAYATDGDQGEARAIPQASSNSTGGTYCNLPPALSAAFCPSRFFTTPGTAGDVGLEPPSSAPTQERLLTPKLGYLRGGAGGGGGGTHLTGTTTIAGFPPCFSQGIATFADNSAGAGGGGGGALQVHAGNECRVVGVIDASGGKGGDNDPAATTGMSAAPGGSGSGGAILLQSDSVVIQPSAGRLIVQGGASALGTGGSIGGKGGTGLVRVEGNNALSATTVASTVTPTDPGDPTSVKWLSVGPWSYNPAKTTPEEAISGVQSCWLKPASPQGAYFSLDFQDDPVSSSPPSSYGWNMQVIIDFGSGPEVWDYRGSDGNGPTAYGGMYPEEHWGTDLGSSPLVVRFQGARTSGVVSDPCNADPDDPLSGFQFGSQTPWVRRPAELDFFTPIVDILRFQIQFDAVNMGVVNGTLLGATNLRIETQPE